jgi:hypothetical protein
VLRVRIIPGHPDWANVTMETHVEAECAKNALQGTRFGGTTKCDIQFGRAVEEMPAPRQKEIVVPVIDPKHTNRKLHAQVFNDDGIRRVTSIMQRVAEINRPIPLARADPEIANRESATASLASCSLFDWNAATETVPISTTFWYY